MTLFAGIDSSTQACKVGEGQRMRQYVADGAARQAVWALAATTVPPQWERPAIESYEAPSAAHVSERYAERSAADRPSPPASLAEIGPAVAYSRS